MAVTITRPPRVDSAPSPSTGTVIDAAWVNTFCDAIDAALAVLSPITGEWTPVIGGGGGTSGQTYGTQVGRYVKIGQFVWAAFRAQLTAKGTITGAVIVQGLPFTAETGEAIAIGSVKFTNLATNWISIELVVVPNTTTAELSGIQAAGAHNFTGLVTADITNTTSFHVTLCYRASA